MTDEQRVKYPDVRVVVKTPCGRCGATGAIGAHEPPVVRSGIAALVDLEDCPSCDGGYVETEILHPSEPVLIVCGHDTYAPTIVDIYHSLVANHGGEPAGLDALAGRMREWQENNPTLVKCPD
jgi:hypothetical protein